MYTQKFTEDGFTLIELMIVIAIMGVLAVAAVPQYANYTKKSKFAEVVSSTNSYKTAVHICIQNINTTVNCTSGLNGVPVDIVAPRGYLQSLTTSQGVIEATAVAEVDSITFKLTPTYTAANNTTFWTVSGTCLTNYFCKP